MDFIGAPLLDIKPYIPAFDVRQACKIGWIEKKVKNLEKTEDDGRFVNGDLAPEKPNPDKSEKLPQRP